MLRVRCPKANKEYLVRGEDSSHYYLCGVEGPVAKLDYYIIKNIQKQVPALLDLDGFAWDQYSIEIVDRSIHIREYEQDIFRFLLYDNLVPLIVDCLQSLGLDIIFVKFPKLTYKDWLLIKWWSYNSSALFVTRKYKQANICVGNPDYDREVYNTESTLPWLNIGEKYTIDLLLSLEVEEEKC